jgi:hypothetical protein
MSLDVYLHMQIDTDGPKPGHVDLYSRNITHNVAKMWAKAGVFEALYEGQGKTAGEIVDVLAKGVEDMEQKREEYLPLNPSNGWGDYDGALDFLREYATACRENPKATISVSR